MKEVSHEEQGILIGAKESKYQTDWWNIADNPSTWDAEEEGLKA